MKNILIFIVAALTIISCQKQIPIEEEKGTDFGYGAFKYGEAYHTLYGGQTIDVGTVTVGTTEENSGSIYVKFNTNPGWYIKETHVFVGPAGSSVPVNKPGNPRIGHFPYSTEYEYSDYTTEVYYPTIDYVDGEAFVIATHAVVYSDDGQEETAWGYNDDDATMNTKFSGKRWGWFQSYSYQGQAAPVADLLYLTQYIDGVLYIYQVNLLTGEVSLISQEEFDAGIGGTINAAAWDPESNMFLFVSQSGSELWGSNFNEDEAAYFIGNLDAVALNGAFVGNTYYFIDENSNIWAVTFDSNMQISGQSIINSLDANLDIQDIAISPDGQLLYIVVNNNGVTELLVYNLNDNTYSVLASLGNNEFQVAVDEEGDIVVIEEIPGEDNSVIHDVNENTGEMDNSTDIDVDVEDVVTGPRI